MVVLSLKPPIAPTSSAETIDFDSRIDDLEGADTAFEGELTLSVRSYTGVDPTGVTDSYDGIQAAIVAAEALAASGKGVTLDFRGGSYLLDKASAGGLKLTRDNSAVRGRIILKGQGAEIVLSSNVPRFLDFTKVADDDLFRNITVEDFEIDTASIGGRHHIIIGTYQAGSSQTNISLKDILVRRVKLKSVASTADDAAMTNLRYGVYFSPSGTNATVNVVQNLVVEDIDQMDGGGGCVYLGSNTSTSVYTYDNLHIRDCRWDRGFTPAVTGVTSNGFYIGSRATGGRMSIERCYARGAGDINFEVNGVGQGVVRDCVAVDAYNNNYLLRGATGTGTMLYTAAQRILYERCVSRVVTGACRGFKIGIAGTDPALGTVHLKDCSHYAALESILTNKQAIHQADQTNSIKHLIVENFDAVIEGMSGEVVAGTITPTYCYFDKGAGKLTVKGLSLKLSGSISRTAGNLSCRWIWVNGDYAMDWDRVDLDDTGLTITGTNTVRGFYLGINAASALRGTIRRYRPVLTSATGIDVASTGTLTITPELLLDDCNFTGMLAGTDVTIDATQRTKVRVERAKNRTFPTIPSVVSATATTLPHYGDLVDVTGTTTITSVIVSWIGRRVTIRFTGALTFTDGSNLFLAGNFVTTADDTITLVCDGTNWIETSRSVN